MGVGDYSIRELMAGNSVLPANHMTRRTLGGDGAPPSTRQADP